MGWERALALCAVHLPIQLLSTHTSKRRSVARTELAMRCLWSRFQLAAPLSDLSMETRSVDRSNRFGSRWWWWHRDRGTQAAAFDPRQRLVVGFHISRQNGGGGGAAAAHMGLLLPSFNRSAHTNAINTIRTTIPKSAESTSNPIIPTATHRIRARSRSTASGSPPALGLSKSVEIRWSSSSRRRQSTSTPPAPQQQRQQ